MATSSSEPVKRHASTPLDRQRSQLEKLLKDPAKPAYVPPPPKEKTVRPPREMMKNVQGSSAGAGSGEFHVYKASRRREYERLKLMEEISQQEADQMEFERKKREREEQAEAKTAKNRAKRQKKRAKAKGGKEGDGGEIQNDGTFKKRRLINGKELVFKKREEGSEDEDEGVEPDEVVAPTRPPDEPDASQPPARPAVDTAKIIVHEDD